MVGVSGFEPEASWTRTKRDTKLRHTPLAITLYANLTILSSLSVSAILYAESEQKTEALDGLSYMLLKSNAAH